MPVHETIRQRADRRDRELRRRIGSELRAARVAASLSQRAVARLAGIAHHTVGRIERGDVRRLSLGHVTRIAVVVGTDVSVSLHPTGSPVRDAPTLALLARFTARLHASFRFRREVPMPIPGDLRAVDGYAKNETTTVMVEAETHVGDHQALLRRARAKQRDLGGPRLVLLLSESAHHRRLLADHPELRTDFPVSSRTCLGALGAGRDPGGDAIVLL